MIDTNKYEGMTYDNRRTSGIELEIAVQDLLAEVKRLRELIKEIAQHDAKEYWNYELLQKVEMIE